MIGDLFNTLLYQPIYNGLVFLLDILPGADLGLAVVLLTLIVRFILLPLSLKAIKTQQETKKIQPLVKELQEKYKKDREKLALELMALYKEHNVKPFSGLLIIIVQIPIVIALYYVFLRGGLPVINPDLLYSFIHAPLRVDTLFLGFIDIAEKSLPLAVLAGISQYFQTKLAMPEMPKPKKRVDGSFSMKDEFARSMSVQMKYVFPFLIFFIAYTFQGAIALYLTTGSIFHILQELYVKKKGLRGSENRVNLSL